MANERVIEIFEGLLEKMKQLIEEKQITHNEYREFGQWFDRLGQSGEIPLFSDVFFETHVLRGMYGDLPGTEPSLLGPYYIENTPILEKPYVLPQRPDEKGEVLVFTGNIKSLDGSPLGNAKISMWQADEAGLYSHFAPGIPDNNLRGQFKTDGQGSFTVKTIIPTSYQIPMDGPTGEFVTHIDSHPNRPAHLHFIVDAEGHDQLITQIYFEGDQWLETDVADGVRDSLIIKLEKKDEFTVGIFNFSLRPVKVLAEAK